MEIFVELGILLAIATLLAILMRLLKQPLIVGYILAGVVAGPYFLNVLHSKDEIELFSKLGITILLFIVGLSLSPKIIKEVGKVSLIGGLGQIIFTTLIGFSIAIFLGIERVAAIYIAIALTFSSTIIVLKLLSDRGDLNKLYGKIAIGFLIVQDVVATIVLLFVSAFTKSQDIDILSTVGILIIKALVLFVLLYIVSIYIIPKISKFIAASQEILFLFSISWGIGIATIFYSLGLSMEIGALIAGVTLSLTPFSYEIAARLKPLRDFFIVLFFVLLGSQLVLDNVSTIILPSIILSLFVLIGNPVIVILIMNILGHKSKIGFMTGLTVAQISEFSLILAALGFSIGHISQDVLSIITIVGLVTITGSTYLLLYADPLYKKAEWLLKFLELEKKAQDTGSEYEKYKIILFGYDRVGQEYIDAFEKTDQPYLVVDFNPESIQKIKDKGILYKFGDAEDIEFLNELNLSTSKLCVSTLSDFKTNVVLTHAIREVNKRAVIIQIADNAIHAHELYAAGASYVVVPHHLGAMHAISLLKKHEIDFKKFEEEKQLHLSHLAKNLQ